MKIPAIRRECLRKKRFNIVTDGYGVQWVGHYGALWPVEVAGMRLTQSNVPALFDLNEAQRAKITIVERVLEGGYADPLVDIHPHEDADIPCQTAAACLWYENVLYRLLYTENGVLLIDTAALKPAESKDEYLTFHMRRNAKGEVKVACLNGMLVSAIVQPLHQHLAGEVLRAVGKPFESGLLQTGREVPETMSDKVDFDRFMRLFEEDIDEPEPDETP